MKVKFQQVIETVETVIADVPDSDPYRAILTEDYITYLPVSRERTVRKVTNWEEHNGGDN